MAYSRRFFRTVFSINAACLVLWILADCPALADIPFAPIEAPPTALPGTTIIPTDIVPLPMQAERQSFGQVIQTEMLQRLPTRFYFTATLEESLRYESNPFQYPTKRMILQQQLPQPADFMNLPQAIQVQDLETMNLAGNDDTALRTMPNLTAGWAFNNDIQLFANYFVIRDYMMNNHRLNTTVQSISGGIQKNFRVTNKSNLQAVLQCREFYQTSVQPVFDYLPGLTYSYVVTPRTIAYVNGLVQLRGKQYMQAPTREIDPFYTAGFMYQKNGWSFSNTVTLNQNFRQPFGGKATVPINNYAIIGDFEIARRLYRSLPGLQVFLRAEPIWNFHAHNYPGFAGVDFRFYYGLRLTVGKPPLTASLQQLRRELESTEATPTPGTPEPEEPTEPTEPTTPTSPKPRQTSGAPEIMPLLSYQIPASVMQPIYGYIYPDSSGGTNNYLPVSHITIQDIVPAAPVPLKTGYTSQNKTPLHITAAPTSSIKNTRTRILSLLKIKNAPDPRLWQGQMLEAYGKISSQSDSSLLWRTAFY